MEQEPMECVFQYRPYRASQQEAQKDFDICIWTNRAIENDGQGEERVGEEWWENVSAELEEGA